MASSGVRPGAGGQGVRAGTGGTGVTFGGASGTLSGGSESLIGGSTYHTFTSNADLTVLDAPVKVSFLLVGGGGGGGSNVGGGGGAGGVIIHSMVLSPGVYPVVIGAGGSGGTGAANGSPGSPSTFNGLTALGGGYGGGTNNVGGPGGSGGGGGIRSTNTSGGAALADGIQGRRGGHASSSSSYDVAGGGGGASSQGEDVTATLVLGGGDGGHGIEWPPNSGLWYAGGGGGSWLDGSGPSGYGGNGGGGAGGNGSTQAGVAGTPNTGGGGGGGGSASAAGGSGGSGVFIITQVISLLPTGGRIVDGGGFRFHIWDVPTSGGPFEFDPGDFNLPLSYFVVGGGGGSGGGEVGVEQVAGGAGGVVRSGSSVIATLSTVTIGSGGVAGVGTAVAGGSGGTTSISGVVVATGGGGGGTSGVGIGGDNADYFGSTVVGSSSGAGAGAGGNADGPNGGVGVVFEGVGYGGGGAGAPSGTSIDGGGAYTGSGQRGGGGGGGPGTSGNPGGNGVAIIKYPLSTLDSSWTNLNIYDAFNRPNASGILGGRWGPELSGGVVSVSSNVLRKSGGGTSIRIATGTTPGINQDVSIDVINQTSDLYLIGRYLGSPESLGSYYMAGYESGSWVIYRYNPTGTLIASIGGAFPLSGQTLRFSLVGSTLTLLVDDVPVLTVNDSTITGRGFGFRVFDSTTDFDNFKASTPNYGVFDPSFPSTISGLATWLDASDSDTISAAGPVVSSWADKGYNGYSFTRVGALGSTSPQYGLRTLNGLRVVDFNGGNLIHNGNNLYALGTQTWFVVAVVDDGAVVHRNIFNENAGVSSELGLRSFNTTNTQWIVFQGSTTYVNLQSTSSPLAWRKYTVEWTPGSSAALRVNELSEASVGSHSHTSTASQISVGGSYSTTRLLDGAVAEVLVYDSALSTLDRESVEDYLSAKWGV